MCQVRENERHERGIDKMTITYGCESAANEVLQQAKDAGVQPEYLADCLKAQKPLSIIDRRALVMKLERQKGRVNDGN